MAKDANAFPILAVDDLEISFGMASVVKGVNLVLAPGEILALVGESGSGKSMLGRAIIGLLPGDGRVSRGRIRFRNQEVTSPKSPDDLRTLRGKEIGLIFQEPLSSLNPNMRIGEQMFEAMREHTDLDETQIHDRAIDMLQQVKLEHPERLLNRFPHEFSGGMRQRIMIASVMMLKPALLIADEPTTALDAVVQKEVLDVMAQVARANGTAVILISHDLAVVAAYAARIAVMEQGILVETGEARTVLNQPQHEYTRKLLAAAQLGRPDPIMGATGAPLLAIEGLCVEFSDKKFFGVFGNSVTRAVQDVSLNVQPGEFVGLVGESGSGKSTIGRAVGNLAPRTAGKISFAGQDLNTCGPKQERALRQRIRFVFQDPFSSLNPRMRIDRIIREGLRHNKSLSDSQKSVRVDEMLQAVGLARDMARRFPHMLSGGQRQRVAIARALVSRPELIIADEPVSALDVTVQAQILSLLKDLQKEFGFACLFISHDLHIVEQLCARLYVLNKGRIMEQAKTSTLFAMPHHPYTRRLLSASPRLEQRSAGLEVTTADLPKLPETAGPAFFEETGSGASYRLTEIDPDHFVAFRGAA